MSTCSKAETLRDYAFDELAADERRSMEQHIPSCADCAADLNELRLTTAALKILPDREIPQRIAFVSDKVFSPSPMARFFGGFWNSAARLGFASACVVAGALIFSAWHRPAQIQTIVQTADISATVARQVNDAVTKAVNQVRAEDAQFTRTALEASERRHDQEHRALMVTVRENMDVLQKRLGTYQMLASAELQRTGEGQ